MSRYTVSDLLNRLNSEELKTKFRELISFNNSRELAFDKIKQANPSSNLFKDDYQVSVLGDGANLQIKLKLKESENVRKKYKNPEHEYLFNINSVNIEEYLNVLEIPDVVRVTQDQRGDDKWSGPLGVIADPFYTLTDGNVFTSYNFTIPDNDKVQALVIAPKNLSLSELSLEDSSWEKSGNVFIRKHDSENSVKFQHEEWDLLAEDQAWEEEYHTAYQGVNRQRDINIAKRACKVIWFVFDDIVAKDEETIDNNDLSLVRDDLTRNLSSKPEHGDEHVGHE